MTSSAPEKIEIWESTIPGRVSMQIENNRGRPQHLTTLGAGQRVRLTASQRGIVQEQIRDEQNDPFKNGMLLLVNRDEGVDEEASRDELSDDDLSAVFDVQGEDFMLMLNEFSQVNVRRLKVLAQPRAVDNWPGAAKAQLDAIDENIATRWPLGGDTPTYREMKRTPS